MWKHKNNIAYTGGVEQGRFALTSATGEAHLRVAPEQDGCSLQNRDMVYLPMEMVGDNGEILVMDQSKVSVTVDGPAEFMGFGTDEPCPTENFMDHTRTLYDGRAILVLRPTAVGTVKVHLQVDGADDAEVAIDITE